MTNLLNKNILIGITGSIAAYKTQELIRLLRAEGANIKVVMTASATQFVSVLTLQALSLNPVHTDLLDAESEARMSHISLAKWADLLLVVPATACIMSKFATGLADDLLSTLYLATHAQVVIVPAMNRQMWQHVATVHNKELLQARHIDFLGPDFGEQACGDVGLGRMMEPKTIVQHLENFFAPKLMAGMHCLITAGPTREPIDPVRYLSNHSSGKMGYALAESAKKLGAKVTLISGPTALPVPYGVECINILTADDMYQAVMESIKDCQIFIAAAAVGDFKPAFISEQKIKKSSLPAMELVENRDILRAVSQLPDAPFLVGFAAETENLLAYAKEKLEQKNLDMIIANEVGQAGFGFESDENKVLILNKAQDLIELPLSPKKELAEQILALVYQRYCSQCTV